MATTEATLSQQLKDEEKNKNSNLSSYYNQVNGNTSSNTSATDYSSYLANQNANLQKSSTSGVNNSNYNLSQYDQKLSQDGINGVIAGKDKYIQGMNTNNQALKDEGYLDAQLARAIYGNYIDNVGDGTGYQSFGYGNLSAAERQMSIDDQNEILRAKLGYMYSKTDADKKYWSNYAESIRKKYGFSGGADGSGYEVINNTNTSYSGYNPSTSGSYSGYSAGDTTSSASRTSGQPLDAYNSYQSQIDELNTLLANREYNPETDPAYQAYKAQYERNASAAANNSLAQAAGNTGGIANSYALALANAAQQAYMKQLTDIIPTLQQQQTTDRQNLLNSLLQQQQTAYSTVAGERDFDYNKWLSEAEFAKAYAQLAQEKELDQAARDWQTEQNNIERRLAGYNV